MCMYENYLKEIEDRKGKWLNPKPIDGAKLLSEIISQIKDAGNVYREDSLNFFIYNVLPGTTSAAGVKAKFLKEIILGDSVVEEITPEFAYEQLSHMKGGPSVEVLLDLALGADADLAKQAADVLKTQVFLYEADTDRLEEAFKNGNTVAKDIIESYAQAEFFTKLPDVEEEIDVVDPPEDLSVSTIEGTILDEEVEVDEVYLAQYNDFEGIIYDALQDFEHFDVLVFV